MGKESDEDWEGEGLASYCFFQSDVLVGEEGNTEVEFKVTTMT